VIPPPPDGALAPRGGGPRGLPAVTFRWWEAILLYLVVNVLLGGLVFVAIAGGREPGAAREIGAGLALDAVFLSAMVLWLRRAHPGSAEAIGTRSSGRVIGAGLGLGAILYAIVAFALAGGLTWVFDRLSSVPVEVPSQLPDELGTVGGLLAVILAVVVAPVAEELYFRGILYRSVRDPYGVGLGTAVSAGLFGLAHYVPADGLGVWVLPLVMIVTGIALAQIYERSGTIVAPIVTHMAFNAIGITLILTGIG
jgi:hypothetical protein